MLQAVHEQAEAQERCRKHRHAARMSIIPGGGPQSAQGLVKRTAGARPGLKKAHGGLRKNPHSTDQITLDLPPSRAHPPTGPCKATETPSVQGDSPSKVFPVLTIPRGLPARTPN